MSASGIPDNQIWYTTNDGNIIEPMLKPSMGAITAEYGFGSTLTSNQYYDKGIIKTYGVITQIGRVAFNEASSLISITLPRQVAVIYYGAFDGCTSLSQIDLKNVTTIGGNAFRGCTSLTSITIPGSVTSIGNSAFYDCTSLKAFYGKFASADNHCLIVDGVLNSFAIGCGATEYTIPDSVTSIRNFAFYDCTSLTSVTIPDSVTEIGYEAFAYCYSLKEVYCKATTPPTGEQYMFANNASSRKIYVPRNSVNAYKSATYWRNYASYIEGYDF